jgi:hypothetical protein
LQESSHWIFSIGPKTTGAEGKRESDYKTEIQEYTAKKMK